MFCDLVDRLDLKSKLDSSSTNTILLLDPINSNLLVAFSPQMPPRALAPTITIFFQTVPAFSIPERSSTPFPEDISSDRFDYPFPTTQTQLLAEQVQPPCPSTSRALFASTSYALPPSTVVPRPSPPWVSPSVSNPPVHAQRPIYFYGSGTSTPFSDPSSPVSSTPTPHAYGHRRGHAHSISAPMRLCAQAAANARMPPSLARKMDFSVPATEDSA